MPEITLKEMKDILKTYPYRVHIIESQHTNVIFSDCLREANATLGNPICKYVCMEPKYKARGKVWLVAYEDDNIDSHEIDLAIAKAFGFKIQLIDDIMSYVNKNVPVKCKCR